MITSKDDSMRLLPPMGILSADEANLLRPFSTAEVALSNQKEIKV